MNPLRPLHFRKNGTFRIVQFTDIHWQNDDPADWLSRDLMQEILNAEAPDLVVFTGDIIHSELCDNPAAAFAHAVSAVSESGTPWAFVFGNHDAEEGITREALMTLSGRLPGCIAQRGPSECSGVGNYSIIIGGSEDCARTAAVLYLFDSGSKAPQDIGGAAWIEQDQIQWYRQQSLRYRTSKNGGAVPSLAFFHIPLPEYNDLWDFHTCYGTNLEGVGSPRINSGLFHAFWESGDVKGVFAGHDHLNDYWGYLHGISLCYGRTTGFNAYGRDGLARGARVIELREGDGEFATWLRLEGGVLVKEQPLHSPLYSDLALQLKKRLPSSITR
ncbi:3',5'-cyclic adenosine monophosphate phosphodiesterase CpdA [Paenibacillus plantiphilus]|uniref:3',5'-cyclic adenosine monophosphate phosphodiesterase CpdA n=1 Tax=Paenibacillus plantiphilus TaxID=2905650 RepID=A0ABN8GFB0_9BACL|nr:metallophosphoesterase family protein [Paenibacillus plantiphilus]CAH1201847.1 3',5'-cyclic adenosine monophosphate phosphodiesterase CpdA [Paenibacillus plantiphilus]